MAKGAIETIVKPLGLITQPNKAGGQYPPGAMSTCLGWFMRDPGVLTMQNLLATWQAGTWGTVATNIQAIPVPDSAVTSDHVLVPYLTNTGVLRYQWIRLSGVSGDAVLTLGALNEQLAASNFLPWTSNRGRYFALPKNSALIWDASEAATVLTPRTSGLTPPVISSASTTSSPNGTALPVPATGAGIFYHTHLVAVFRRVMADGYEMVSAPSPADQVTFADNSNILINVSWLYPLPHSTVKAGDFVDIYRTHLQQLTPGRTNTGADYYFSCSHKLTSGEVAVVGCQFTDYTGDTQLGEALYTNPGVRGAAAQSLMPQPAKCTATFRGYTFQGNITERPSISWQVGSFWGAMGIAGSPTAGYRANGIGSRSAVATSTNASNVLTAISATDIVGFVPGQILTFGGGATIATPTTITAVGATTITMSNSVTAGGGVTQTWTFADVIEINGRKVPADDPSTFAFNVYQNFGDAPFALQMLDRVISPGFTGSFASTNGRDSTAPADKVVLYIPYSLEGAIYDSFTIRATHGFTGFAPPLPQIEFAETALTVTNHQRKNLIVWSESNQPDNWPSANSIPVGAGEIYQIVPTRDALWIFASDGLWRLAGTGGQAGDGYDWRVDPVDSTLSLAGPQMVCVLRDTVYAYTNRGLVSIDSSGSVTSHSELKINNLLPGPPWVETFAGWMTADETNDEVYFKVPESTSPYVYNTRTDAFTQLSVGTGTSAPTQMQYVRTLQAPLVMTPAGAQWLLGTVSNGSFSARFQPIFGDDPFQQYHWQQVYFLFDYTADGALFFPQINGVNLVNGLTGATLFRLVQNGDGNAGGVNFPRVAVAVPRSAPAVSPNISPGLAASAGSFSTVGMRFFGLSFDLVPITRQRRRRNQGG